MFDKNQTYIVYDGECPFCSQYVKLLRLREAIGPVTLLNAREDNPVVRHVRNSGVDLNQEMALVIGGQIYSGPDCMHRLALMSTGAGFFNGIAARIFSSPRTAKFMYPILRTGRNATLKLLGKRPIEHPAA